MGSLTSLLSTHALHPAQPESDTPSFAPNRDLTLGGSEHTITNAPQAQHAVSPVLDQSSTHEVSAHTVDHAQPESDVHSTTIGQVGADVPAQGQDQDQRAPMHEVLEDRFRWFASVLQREAGILLNSVRPELSLPLPVISSPAQSRLIAVFKNNFSNVLQAFGLLLVIVGLIKTWHSSS